MNDGEVALPQDAVCSSTSFLSSDAASTTRSAPSSNILRAAPFSVEEIMIWGPSSFGIPAQCSKEADPTCIGQHGQRIPAPPNQVQAESPTLRAINPATTRPQSRKFEEGRRPPSTTWGQCAVLPCCDHVDRAFVHCGEME